MKELELLQKMIECLKDEIRDLEKFETARFDYLNMRIIELEQRVKSLEDNNQ